MEVGCAEDNKQRQAKNEKRITERNSSGEAGYGGIREFLPVFMVRKIQIIFL
jgi:hypothetical protein